jgi:hypothetical protein
MLRYIGRLADEGARVLMKAAVDRYPARKLAINGYSVRETSVIQLIRAANLFIGGE